jgi:hypothetical protein
LFVFEEYWTGSLAFSAHFGDIELPPDFVKEKQVRLNAIHVSEEAWLGIVNNGRFSKSWSPRYKLVTRLPEVIELEALETVGEFEQLCLAPRETTLVQADGDFCAQQIQLLGLAPFPALSGWEAFNKYHTTATWYLCSVHDSYRMEIMVIDAMISIHKDQSDWQVDGFLLYTGTLRPET